MFTAPKFSLEGANPGTELIVSARFVDAVSVWEVPVMVTVAGPRAAVLLAVSISTLVPVVGFGVNDAVTPLGKPDAASWTLPANPYRSVTVIPDVPEPPWTMLRDAGEALRLKLGGGLTVRVSTVIAFKEPELPFMVRL